MNVLHLVSFHRWTGAAAPAFGEVEALREAGVEAYYGYIGGSTLEEKVSRHPFSIVLLRRGHDPYSIVKSIRRLRRTIDRFDIDIIHAHLSHDHWLARASLQGEPGVGLVRTFHASRPVRVDPLTRWLLGRTDGICVVNQDLARSPLLSRLDVTFTPPPVDRRVYRPDGPSAKAAYGLAANAPLIGFIGKMAPGRGFEEAIRTFALLRQNSPKLKMLLIGRGEQRARLEAFASAAGVGAAIIWAGYHEESLPEHYRAMDLMLFTRPGSDEGHRAVIEAMACGTPVACSPVRGIDAVLGTLAPDLIARDPSPEALAAVVLPLLKGGASELREPAEAATRAFDYGSSAARLRALYASLIEDKKRLPARFVPAPARSQRVESRPDEAERQK